MQSIKSVFYLLLFLMLVGCSQKNKITALEACSHIEPSTLNGEILKYQELVEETLSVRKITINYMNDFNKSKPLTGQNIDDIRIFTKKHLLLRKKFDYYLDKYACLMDRKKSSNLEISNRLKGGMIALSSALILYDNYQLAISLYERDKRLRRLINSEDVGYGLERNSLAKITESYSSDENRKKVISAIAYYKKNIKKIKNIDDDIYLSYLQKLIIQSLAYQKSKSLGEKFWFKMKMARHQVRDDFHNLWDITLNLFSKIFGNSVGLVETRKGKLYNNKTILSNINCKIKSGDILLEKTPFRLTDSLIPGYWGHVAIYIGKPEELKELGIWEHPLVQKYHHQIKKEKYVVEALRDGVKMNTLRHFLNIDDFSILRYQKESREEKIKRIILTLRQVGKEYDFNFDIETSDKIVCSELVYISCTTINWQTDKLLGRHTISPDNVAIKSVEKQSIFSIVNLIHDGKVVQTNQKKFMKKLLGLK